LINRVALIARPDIWPLLLRLQRHAKVATLVLRQVTPLVIRALGDALRSK
jgi:hypothetical protein